MSAKWWGAPSNTGARSSMPGTQMARRQGMCMSAGLSPLAMPTPIVSSWRRCARSWQIAAQVAAMAASGLRVIGVACATFAAPPLPSDQHDFDFTFLGLLALEDPVRPEVPAAVAQCRAAGMRVVMITGYHPATALSIARPVRHRHGRRAADRQRAQRDGRCHAAAAPDAGLACAWRHASP